LLRYVFHQAQKLGLPAPAPDSEDVLNEWLPACFAPERPPKSSSANTRLWKSPSRKLTGVVSATIFANHASASVGSARKKSPPSSGARFGSGGVTGVMVGAVRALWAGAGVVAAGYRSSFCNSLSIEPRFAVSFSCQIIFNMGA
jgi:hypothetical protein